MLCMKTLFHKFTNQEKKNNTLDNTEGEHKLDLTESIDTIITEYF